METIDAALQRLTASLRISDVCHSGSASIGTDSARLAFGPERSIVASAVESRRREFGAGRALLRSLVATDGPIGRRDSGAPALPAGWVGSLAHDRGIAVAVAAAADSVEQLGVDVEPDVALEAEVARLVRRGDDSLDDPLECFVAKEAAYKAWSAADLVGILDFSDVRLDDDPPDDDDDGTTGFVAVEVATGRSIRGRLTRTRDRVLALAALPH